jgi:HlyD family secretion protein
VKHVRKEDQKLLEGTDWDKSESQESTSVLSAEEKAEARKKQNRRHVWLVEGDKLRALEVIVGLSDSKFTELVEGNLKANTKLVTGIEPRQAFGG